jgi:opacity protein-like surface antigen
MGARSVRCLVVVAAFLAFPFSAYAQEAILSGTVTDSTGAVTPGVTIEAIHDASGNTFVTVTDERGAYRLAVRAGAYQITAMLKGFGAITRSGLELLLGQQAVINLQLSPSGVQESVTVTGEAPLIEVTSSTLGSNIDPRQMAEIPVNGRDWASLVVMAAGNRTNAQGNGGQPTPVEERDRRDFQLNVDGQQVTQNMSLGTNTGNPLYSRDAIAEFQFLASRFDATQGRSSGVQVNVITKAGTNRPSGLFSGYFRDDRFNARDFFSGTVLPYSNQQLSTTYGGPIRRDRIHFFVNYEYEREPSTIHGTTPWPAFNIDVQSNRKQQIGGARVDFQLSPERRLMVRANKANETRPVTGSAAAHPSTWTKTNRRMDQLFATLTQVLSNQTLNELKIGYASQLGEGISLVNWPNHPQAINGITTGAPRIQFTGFTIGSTANIPQVLMQDVYSIRNDLTTTAGRHTVKVGGEYIFFKAATQNCRECNSTTNAQGGPVPANIQQLIPVWNDVSTWNIAALSPITRQYRIAVGQTQTYQTRHYYAGWLQDDWTLTSRLTLNLGVRYDVGTRLFGNDIELPPLVHAGRPNDTNNVAPRFGFAYKLTELTVLRGGTGIYFADVINNISSRMDSWNQLAGVDVPNDGRPDFAANPFNGPIPTKEQVEARYCSNGNAPGCLRRSILQIADPNAQVPFSYQTSVGVQRQFGSNIAIEADYAYTGSHNDDFNHNVNLTYNPATGANYPFSDISRRAYPDYGILGLEYMALGSNIHQLQTAFTKRMSNRWQASATYTLGGYWDRDAQPLSGLTEIPFAVTPDLGGQYTLAENDQRHRAVFNGIWEAGFGFQLSGLYFYGSGTRFFTNYGGDLRNTGGANRIDGRLRPDGSIVPRNNLVGQSLHRVDIRLQRRFSLGARLRIDGMVEAFNLFNHQNYGSYVTAESNRDYGRPVANPNVVYQPRMLQLGFRATF